MFRFYSLVKPISGYKVKYCLSVEAALCSGPSRSYHLSQSLIEAQHQSQNGCQVPVHAAALMTGRATVCDPSPGAGERLCPTPLPSKGLYRLPQGVSTRWALVNINAKHLKMLLKQGGYTNEQHPGLDKDFLNETQRNTNCRGCH